MPFLQNLISGLKTLFHKNRQSLEMDEELNSFLEAATQEKVRAGLNAADAMRAARVEMGSIETVKEKVRSSTWESALESLAQDIRYGARQLIRSPGFSVVAILTLALGIGANTAIFTLIHTVMLKQLPIANPHQLYRVGEGEDYCCEWGGLQNSWGMFDYDFYKHLRDTNPAFEQLAAVGGGMPSFNVRRANSSAAAQTAIGEYVSGNYFSTLGLQPNVSRLLNPSDDTPQAPAVAVMSYRLWQQQYASDPSILGSTLLVNDLPVTLVGITPPEFFGDRLRSNPPDLWIPLSQEPAFEGLGKDSMLYSSGMAWLFTIARLKPGVSPAQLQPQLTLELQQWLRDQGRVNQSNQDKIAQQHIQVIPAGNGISDFRDNSKGGLYLLSIVSGLVLLIACANLANLLLARSVSRRQQTALRLSLGATRSRLIRAVLTESVLLSLLGGIAGVFLAYVGAKAILLIAFRGANYVPIDATPSLPILLFALLLSLLTGIVFGVTPAWLGTKADPAEGLRGSSRSNTQHSTSSQKTLVIVQAALSVVLLVVAGLVTESLRNLEKTNFGFQTQGRLLADINVQAAGYQPEQLPALYQELQRRFESTPGVHSASLSLYTPQNNCCINLNIIITGRPASWIEETNVLFLRITPHYFETIGTPLLTGRTFNEDDTPSSQHVAVVDESFARKFFPGESPIGKSFGLALNGHGHDFEIVGVVRDTKYHNLGATTSPMYFLPFTQTTQYEPSGYRRLETSTLYARSIQLNVSGAPESYEAVLRNILASVNPNLTIDGVRSYSEQVAIEFNQQRLIARLTGLFSLLALLLASVGLYGVTTYNVTRRTGEIGVRMALGANRANVVAMVLRGAFTQIAIGLGIGVPLAILCDFYLAHQLYGVSPFNPIPLAGAIFILSLCALIAGLIPARRAASIEPMEALRIE
jgi:predicted permease